MPRPWCWFIAMQLLVSGAAAQGTTGSGPDPPRPGVDLRPVTPSTAPKPLTIFGTVSNGIASNIHFDQEDVRSVGVVIGGGLQYALDDFQISYELAGHSYSNTTRWDRISQRVQAAYERNLPGDWKFETVGRISFKGSSEDLDLVDRDFEVTPRLEYRFTPSRRLRLFTLHRFKRYDDTPDDNAAQHRVGAEFREVMAPGRHWEVGGRAEVNDERLDRGDYLRWTYWLEHSVPITGRDALVMQIRYRLRRYTHRLVEAEDEDVPRLDHRWEPGITWVRTLGPRYEVRFEYAYDSNYSNDPDRSFGAHMMRSSFGLRW